MKCDFSEYKLKDKERVLETVRLVSEKVRLGMRL